MNEKRTLVLGASLKPDRYSYLAVLKLIKNGIPVEAVGLKEGDIEGVRIHKPFPMLQDIHTITLYIGPKNQPIYYAYIIGLKPRRVIFNPGTENDELEEMLAQEGIEVLRDCTLVMLNRGIY